MNKSVILRLKENAELIKYAVAEHKRLQVSPESVIPPNDVFRNKVLTNLVRSMRRRGWIGRPLLVLERDNNKYIGFTGSHRTASAKKVGIKIPIYVVNTERNARITARKLNIPLKEMYDEDRRKLINIIGDEEAKQIMEKEFDI